ncbi:small subunit ribosomal protein S4 [Breznakia sp. PF5-3]|uniref:30S ribosomal protein S4 n=1 Tax=unclassified Breznakia TaxID=2623764 RepID=UPI00240666F8|nr:MULTISPECIES: 30S ribosomal protein S4 [unclassified Breznakia]MDF9823930.1 small subunit ribosomal protein S4 [Breznakia sp. PM6-1]MDF9834729.1 small subunit ribosomal protein S4 [Breznakia sp. PF5-3]MDF9836836.1 small subunit ribosomal protein S4 [Breznakia sp. PFB2-8]MDF9858853.1 small subunit ribosomal protein S4 [Breznakia sp. PH5-24]
MARVTKPVFKTSRRLSFSILESGKEFSKGKQRQYAPGQHGPTKRIKLTNYGLQLREKQRLRYMYQMTERQFYNTYKKASKMKGVTGNNFLFLLESRLDNLVYRMGFASTRRGARQLVNHGHLLVDGKKVDIPSYSVKPGQTIEVKEKSKNLAVINESLDAVFKAPAFVDVDKAKKAGKYIRLPERNELNSEINELLIVEFYNR